MSKEEKKPAHEVIFEELEKTWQDSKKEGYSACVDLLCRVLEKMKIPKESLRSIIKKLQELHKKTPEHDMADRLEATIENLTPDLSLEKK